MPADLLWYVARAKSNQERLAIDNLQQQGFTAYYPQIQIEREKRGRIIRSIEGLFPGYLFIQCTGEPYAWRSINGTRGIVRLLSFGEDGRPTAMPHGQIELIRAQEKSGYFNLSPAGEFMKGDTVGLRNGPSVGKTGVVIRSRGERVEFLLKLLGRQVKCIAPRHTLYLVAEHK